MVLYLAVSRAGHDRDTLYAVIREQDGFVLLADGKSRTLDKPKRKNRRHVQIIRKIPETAEKLLRAVQTDSDLIHALRIYKKEVSRESTQA